MTEFHSKSGKPGERVLSVVVFSLLFSWMLAFPFEGQILYSLADYYRIEPHNMVFGAIAATFAGLLLCGFFIKTMKAARRMLLASLIFCFTASAVFLFPPSALWFPALVSSSFAAGGCVAAWGFYFRSGTPKNQRIKTAADGLACSNILMIFLNVAAVHLSPGWGLGCSMLALVAAFLFALRLPSDDGDSVCPYHEPSGKPAGIARPLAFLFLFIVVITINSGLMYQVQGPAFSQLKWLTSWYWAVPYIAALFVMRNLPRRVNRSYILYIGIAMIGFSFIFFRIMDRSAASYLVVDTLMLGACGVYDLFWWSILGEMLDFDRNAAKVLGIGLSANVFGVLLGGMIGNAITSAGLSNPNATMLALAVVCVTLALLPLLHQRLSALLKDHAYLAEFSEMPPREQGIPEHLAKTARLSERELQVASLLLQRKTYKMIAGELFISENTVKYYVKNLYAKLEIQNRSQLIDLALHGVGSNTVK